MKLDKKNHDRTLFQQEEIDEDLIITVRRGYEFLDAYQACMHRDLRQKYKIVFYNEQGMEEEGVDGGGIIKEFINRVLKYICVYLGLPLVKFLGCSIKQNRTKYCPTPIVI